MEPLDVAFQAFEVFRTKADDTYFKKSIKSEADVRMKIIDPVFTDILGWPMAEIDLEKEAGGQFIDYCGTVDGLNRMIIEAKKDARDLGIKPNHTARFFQLNGAVFHTEAAREGIAQCVRYCGQKNAELACLTNGQQWAIFRGSRIGDGTDTLAGQACVFGSLKAVAEKFKEFYELLAYEQVKNYVYRAIFREAEGQPLRLKSNKKAPRHPESRSFLAADKLSNDLDRVMMTFFRDLTDEQDAKARRECFVTTSESDLADTGLERISESLRDKVRSLDTVETSELTEIIKRVQEMQRNELVLLVGTKGSGKSTFIDRFFADVLPREISQDCIVIRIDLSKSGTNEQGISKWLDEHFLDAAENATFPNGAPSYEEIQGMCMSYCQLLCSGSVF